MGESVHYLGKIVETKLKSSQNLKMSRERFDFTTLADEKAVNKYFFM